MATGTMNSLAPATDQTLHRTIDWRGAFWVASGVPALVLFSIGGIAGTTGKVAFLVWTVSMIWNPMALWAGLFAAALIIPVFLFRHYVQDKGVFPAHMLADLNLSASDLKTRKAGILPYLTLAAGVNKPPLPTPRG